MKHVLIFLCFVAGLGMPLSDLWDNGHAAERPISEEDAAAAELRRYRNKAQTENARLAHKLNAEMRRHGISRDDPEPQPKDVRADFCKGWCSISGLAGQTKEYLRNWELTQKQRACAVYNYLVAWVNTALAFFRQVSSLNHIVLTNIFDDTDVMLQINSKGRRAKVGVMNCLQDLHINYNENIHAWWRVPVPVMLLHGTTGDALYDRFVSWQVFSSSGSGCAYETFGLTMEAIRRCVLMCVTLCLDALRANIVLLKAIRVAIVSHNKTKAQDMPLIFMFSVRCTIHQYNLIRKDICLGLENYWSNMVRLAHLFESHSFRERFKQALIRVISGDFDYFVVAVLPDEVPEWYDYRVKQLRLDSFRSSKNYLQFKRLKQIVTLDNGDPNSSRFVHWCTSCCASLKDSLSKVIAAYLSRFADGFLKPLLYRWKHCDIAQDYVSDSWLA